MSHRTMTTDEPAPPADARVASSASAPGPVPAEVPARSRADDRMIRTVAAALFHRDPEFARYGGADSAPAGDVVGARENDADACGPLCDFLFAAEDEPHAPDDVFAR